MNYGKYENIIRVAALTPQGALLARRLCRELAGAQCWLPEALAGEAGDRSFARVSQVCAEAFAAGDNLVCVMAAGIVVRALAPHLRGKDRDPAVVVVDEAGKFAVSLLSGHLGGANALARQVAQILGGVPVITTATDVHGLPALDTEARRLGLVIENLPGIRVIHMAWLEGRAVGLVDPEGCLAELAGAHPQLFSPEKDLDAALGGGGPGVYAGWEERPWPTEWLILRPRNLVAGMGCHKGTPAVEILDFIKRAFQEEGLSLLSLKALATIEAKKAEPGLKEAAAMLGVDFLWFTAEELKTINAPHPSLAAARHVGAASVSEAAALKAGGVELILAKRKGKNVTLAVARGAWR